MRQQQQQREREQEEEARQQREQQRARRERQAEARRTKARATKRETNRREVILVYEGPDLDQAFLAQHLPALGVSSAKGGVVAASETKAVWLKFGKERRRTAVHGAIRVHNLLVEETLKIRLVPGDRGIVCSKGRRRLQSHELYLHIVAGGVCWSF